MNKQKILARRAELVMEAEAIFASPAGENGELSDEQRTRDDAITAEVASIDGDLKRLGRNGERRNSMDALAEAEVVPQATTEEPDPAKAPLTLGEQLQLAAYVGSMGQGENRLHNPSERILRAAHDFQAAVSGMGEERSSSAGMLVGSDVNRSISQRTYAIGQILQRVQSSTISSNSNRMTTYAVNETSRADGSRMGGIQAYWRHEAGALTGSQPDFKKIELELDALGALVYATDEQIQDAAFLENWIYNNLPVELRFKAEDAIINGTGVGQPLGLLASDCTESATKETGQAAATVVYENILAMWKRRYAPNTASYVWLVDQSVETELYKMSLAIGTGGAPVYLPPTGASGSPYATLMGRPVISHEYGQAVGTVGDIILVDLSQYLFVEKAMQSASSMHVRFLYGEMAYRFLWRVDGRMLWHSALTPKSGGDTQTPVVTLAARA